MTAPIFSGSLHGSVLDLALDPPIASGFRGVSRPHRHNPAWMITGSTISLGLLGARMRVSSGDWKLESCSLLRRVHCEPDFSHARSRLKDETNYRCSAARSPDRRKPTPRTAPVAPRREDGGGPSAILFKLAKCFALDIPHLSSRTR